MSLNPSSTKVSSIRPQLSRCIARSQISSTTSAKLQGGLTSARSPPNHAQIIIFHHNIPKVHDKIPHLVLGSVLFTTPLFTYMTNRGTFVYEVYFFFFPLMICECPFFNPLPSKKNNKKKNWQHEYDNWSRNIINSLLPPMFHVESGFLLEKACRR